MPSAWAGHTGVAHARGEQKRRRRRRCWLLCCRRHPPRLEEMIRHPLQTAQSPRTGRCTCTARTMRTASRSTDGGETMPCFHSWVAPLAGRNGPAGSTAVPPFDAGGIAATPSLHCRSLPLIQYAVRQKLYTRQWHIACVLQLPISSDSSYNPRCRRRVQCSTCPRRPRPR